MSTPTLPPAKAWPPKPCFLALLFPKPLTPGAAEKIRVAAAPLAHAARVDERGQALLNLTGMFKYYFREAPAAVAEKIRSTLLKAGNLPSACAGMGVNSFVAGLCARFAVTEAKVSRADELGKFLLCWPGEEEITLAPLPLTLLPGLSAPAMEKLTRYNVRSIGDLQKLPREFLEKNLGREGERLYEMARGADPGQTPGLTPPVRVEESFPRNVNDVALLRLSLRHLADRFTFDLRQRAKSIRSLTLEVIHGDGRPEHATRAFSQPVDRFDTLAEAAAALFEKLYTGRRSVRTLILRSGRLAPRGAGQLDLFAPPGAQKNPAIGQALDKVRTRYGFKAVGNFFL